MGWKSIPVESGRQEVKGVFEPVPTGPFLLVPQHRADEFERRHFVMSFEDAGIIRIEKFELRYGYVTFGVGPLPNFDPVRCGYFFDTSG